MRICRYKISKKIIESQSGEAKYGTLIRNAISSGIPESEVEELHIPDSVFQKYIDEGKTQAEKDAELKRKQELEQKKVDIETNLPSWIQVSTAIDNISSLSDVKVFLKKITRVVYWDIKDKMG